MSTINPQQPLRRTLKPRDGGGPRGLLTLLGAIAGVIVVGGGIAYAVTAGHRAAPTNPVALSSPSVFHPMTAAFADVTAVTHAGKSKKPAKHGATPAPTATPGSTPTPGATPTTAPTTSPAALKLAAKHAAKHAKPSSLSAIAFDPNAAAQSTTSSYVATAPPAAPQPTVAATPAPTPAATPIYEPAVVVEARFISQIQPIYPEIAKQQGIQGTAIILATVGPNGAIIDENISQSTGNRLLDSAALEAARASKFQAPEVDGHPATETYRIVYTFALNN